MIKDQSRAVTSSELVVETWKRLDSEALGAPELEEIQKVLAATFGPSGVESPASIARTLADIGVTLRHPEVIHFDTAWRDAQSFDSLGFGELDFNTIEASAVSVNTINRVWALLEEQKDARRLANLQRMVSAIRQQLRLLSRSKAVSEQRKKVALEAELWLGIWLQNPQIFEDWRGLRMNSEEFQRVFGQ